MIIDSNVLDFMFIKQGEQGEDGKVLYTWIKYAQDEHGTGMTDDSTGAIYIGVAYNKESTEESDNPADYQWTKILGDPGENGQDAYTVILSNENISFSTNSQHYTVAEQTFQSDIIVYNGSSIVTDYTYDVENTEQVIDITQSKNSITISTNSNSQLSTLSGKITVNIHVNSLTFSKILTWTCALQGTNGQQGAGAKSISVTPSSMVFKSTDGGETFSPDLITITPSLQNLVFGKWQYSADGGSTFVDVNNGTSGITIGSNNILTLSKSSELFTNSTTLIVFKAISLDDSYYDTTTISKFYDVIDAGDGRNLLLNTSSYRESNPLERTGSKTDDYSKYPKIITSIDLSANQKYTLQAKTDSNWATKHDTGGHTPSEKLVGLWLVSDDTNTFLDMSKGYAVFTAPKTTKYKLRINQYSNGTDAYTIHLWDIKLEKGQSASGWSAAPEDLDQRFDSNENKLKDITDSLKGTQTTVTELQSTVDKQAKEITNKVSQDKYSTDLEVINNKLANSNEGLNKWLVSAYQKSLFADSYKDKAVMEMFASKDIVAAQTLLYEDDKLQDGLTFSVTNDPLVFYALTFVYFSESVKWTTTATFKDTYNIYVNGGAIGSAGTAGSNPIVMTFQEGWNSIEIIINSSNNVCNYYFGATLSAYKQCTKMNCYQGTITGRQTYINSKVSELIVNLNGITSRVSDVETGVSNNGEQVQQLSEKYSKLEQDSEGFKTEVRKTYAKREDFSSIGARNLIRNSNTLDFADYGFGDSSTAQEVTLTDKNGNTLQDKNGNTLTATENYTKNYTGQQINNMIAEVIN